MGELFVRVKEGGVVGLRGMVGCALEGRLRQENGGLWLAGRYVVDLQDQAATVDWMAREKPDVVIIAAAKVGGILANNSYPADFLYQNLAIAANCIEGAHRADVDRLLFLDRKSVV